MLVALRKMRWSVRPRVSPLRSRLNSVCNRASIRREGTGPHGQRAASSLTCVREPEQLEIRANFGVSGASVLDCYTGGRSRRQARDVDRRTTLMTFSH
jgi:hypothetical protein